VATDVCGNKDSLTVEVVVADLTAPVNICDEITNVSLDNNGLAKIEAEVFDDGSYDNCCLDSFLVRRMDAACYLADTLFGPAVSFCCVDVDSPVTVVMRAVDCAGNYNDCLVLVEVEDKIAPQMLFCPPTDSIDCGFYADSLELPLAAGDFEVLAQYGQPAFSDNCSLFYLLDTVTWDLDQCYNGEILRLWQVTDAGENAVLFCSQTLTVRYENNWVVSFPEDFTLACGENLPPTGEPQVFFDNCELIASSYTDQVFTVVPDACFKIARTWTVINWCSAGGSLANEIVESSELELGFDLDGDGTLSNLSFRDGLNTGNFDENAEHLGAQPDGVVVHQQIIKVLDETAPVVSCPGQWEVCITDTICTANVELPWPAIQDCSPELTVGAEGELGSGLGPFDLIGPGHYAMTYRVEDNCNNVSTCVTTVVVKDCKKPVPYCANGLSVTLGQDTTVTIHADDLDDGSFDNCFGELVYSFLPDITFNTMTFDCYSLGLVNVEVWVTDAAGNQDFCETFVFVDDNIGVCQGPPLVAGTIATVAGDAVSHVAVILSGVMEKSDSTGVAGTYSFEVEPGGDYTLTPTKNDFLLNGVTTFDLVLITKHILGTESFESPCQLIAADINNSGTVTTGDLVALRKAILQMADEFPNNTSWRFVAKGYDFPDPAHPFLPPFPEVHNANDVSVDMDDLDFVAIKVGDVNGSADPLH
ncbi:MAG: hypothetical protein ACE5FF_10780, partial [Saprospiraceae bacterium]